MTKKELAGRMDHTLLRADATREEIKLLCDEARRYGFASVCVNSCYVSYAKALLEGSQVKVCTVVGFPLGACITDVKSAEAAYSVELGADEVDMVINVGMLKARNFDCVQNDIAQVVNAVQGRAVVKVIIEACLLTDEEKHIACRLAAEAGADFVKTSTGFSSGGATVRDVALMKAASGLRVKAAGGIRDLAAALDMLRHGADRLGTSASVKIIEEMKE